MTQNNGYLIKNPLFWYTGRNAVRKPLIVLWLKERSAWREKLDYELEISI